ncbi:MAG: CoA pyrophosphatase [Clostridia bacterium]|nr:CoA pyrophosphatase [Clostridia bacterium]
MKKTDIVEALETHSCTTADAKLYAITIPLIKRDGAYHLLFEVRAETLRRQPNEICFPGGKVEKDEPIQKAAFRETMEELRLPADAIEMIHSLIPITIPHNIMVFPYVAFINTPFEDLNPNPDEVQELFTVPLEYLLHVKPEKHTIYSQVVVPDDFPFEKIQNGRNYNWNQSDYHVYFFEYEHRIIWGITARITSEFINVMNKHQA